MQLLSLLKELSLHPKNAEELKGLILQFAFEGKLTTKWRDENIDVKTSTKLLEDVLEEKLQLIKQKIIKKEKPLNPITGNLPFELPRTWAWCRFYDFCEKITQGPNPKYQGVDDERYRVLKTKDFYDYKIHYEKCEEVSESIFNEWQRFELKNGDIIFGLVGKGSTGKCNIFEEQQGKKYIFTRATGLFRVLPSEPVIPIFVKLFFNSLYGQAQVERITEGSTGQLVIRTSEIKKLLFPLPPLEEQKAIVEVVNTLFKEVEALEELTKERISLKEDFVTSALRRLTETDNTKQEWNYLQQHFSSFFTEKKNIKSLRETILQLAVQGKLTAQWREENPSVQNASELLKRIEAEKQQLIAEKKIKKEKPLPIIEDKDKPYELPESWVWCKLTELVNVGTGSTPATTNSSYYHEGTIPWYTSSATNDDFAKVQDKLITQKAIDETNCKIFPEGSLIIALYGQGKTRGQISEIVVPGATNQAIAAMVFFNTSSGTKEYLKLFFKKMYHEIRLLAEGGAQPNLNVGKIKATIVPLPSLEETVVIIEKVNALLALCDELEQQVDNSQIQIEQLMQSCLKEVFEQE